VDRKTRPEEILRLKKIYRFLVEIWGFKVFGGVALLPDLLLPVPIDVRCIISLLESGELIKTVFEWSRFLLPVSSYVGLNF